MRRSASTNRRSSLTGVPSVGVSPKSTCAESSRASWLTTGTRSNTHESPTSSANSSPRLGRCKPVATSTVTFDASIPAFSSVSISGRRNKPFGTGRVTSQIRMHAERLPEASSVSAGQPTGVARAWRTAAAGACTSGMDGFATTVTSRSSSNVTGRPVLPYSRSMIMERAYTRRNEREIPQSARTVVDGNGCRTTLQSATRAGLPNQVAGERCGLGDGGFVLARGR